MLFAKPGVAWASICTWAALLQSQVVTAGPRNYPNINIPFPELLGNSFGQPAVNRTFDYVIVGGGTGGLTIAYRLAQKYSVAVIEAGGLYQIDNGNGSTIPGLAKAQFVGPALNDTQPLIDWNFVSQPNPALNNRDFLLARGKTLGGTSARNYMVYQLPTVGALDSWAETVGDSAYTWNNTFQWFRKTATVTPADPSKRNSNASTQFTNNPFQGATGPLPVTWPNYGDPFSSWLAKAFPASGLPISNACYLDGKLSGYSAWSASSMDPTLQQRGSSASSYLAKALLETDLVVYTQALAKQIIFNSNKTATGVRVNTRGKEYFINAKKEVIVSAGAYQSPQLLMVSGIGPQKTLSNLKIPIVKQLEGVGQNLQDHSSTGSAYKINVQTLAQLVEVPYAQQVGQEYLVNRTGPLTSFATFLGWERLSSRNDSGLSAQTIKDLNAARPSDWPQVEYLTFAGSDPRITSSSIPGPPTNYGLILMSLIEPFSRGNITINSTDTADPPIISPNYLQDPRDVEVLVAAIKRVRGIWPSLSGVTVGPEVLPGTNYTTDADLVAYSRETAGTTWHPAASCKMGKSSDSMAVVDTKARVYGVQGLRIVDSSAFPFLTPGHPQSMIYALAEKIANDVLTGN